MKTLIYVRGTNAERQITICEDYAKANGLEIVGAVNNEKELSAFVFGGNIENIIVSEAHRISRSQKEYIVTERMFNNFGVKLTAVGGTL